MTEIEESEIESESNDPAIEEKAKAQGWVPKDEFAGNPAHWCDADEYLERGSPFYLRKKLRDTESQIKDLQRKGREEQQSFEARLERMESLNKAQRNKLHAEIEAARRTAAEFGDVEEYDRLNQAESNLLEQEQQESKPSNTKKQPKDEDVHPDVEKWVRANPWYLENSVLQKTAEALHVELLSTEPTLSIAENLDRVKEELIERFPDKFGKPKGAGKSSVEGAGRMSSSSKRTVKGWVNIPSEEQKILKRHIKEGLFADEKEAAKAYFTDGDE